MTAPSHIAIDPAICPGKPTFRAVNCPAGTILELLASGRTTEEILADYPDLESENMPRRP